MELGLMISLGALIVSALALLRNGHKDGQADAANQAVVQTKLDNIANGVTDIRVEMRTMRGDLNALESRVVRVEERSKSNSHRLDALENKPQGDD